jgi:hypothetical protein
VTLSHAALVSRQCPVSRGRLSTGEFRVSEASLVDFTKARGNTKPHLADPM